MKNNEYKANNKNLLKHLFLTMCDLKERKIDTEEAKAQANLAKQANNVMKYELDRAKTLAKFENIEIREIEDLQN